jgi:hypothetical protein
VRGDFVSRAALKSLETELYGYGFFRCSKGFLVNMANVDGLMGGECIVCGERIPVSRSVRKEFMELLMKYPGRVFPAEEIYERVWNEQGYACENTVMVHIRRIREKIELNPKEPEYLKVVWGIGYKIEKMEK